MAAANAVESLSSACAKVATALQKLIAATSDSDRTVARPVARAVVWFL